MKKQMADSKCSPTSIRYIQDALEVLNGNWRLPILASLLEGTKRFKEIANDVEGISDKMLSKELRNLEMNHLVTRTVYDTFPPAVEYSVTKHAATLREVLGALSDWGYLHRQKIVGKAYQK